MSEAWKTRPKGDPTHWKHLPGKKVEQRLEELGWDWGATGGNCDAYFLYTSSKPLTYWMLTDAGGASIPKTGGANCTLGLYVDCEQITWLDVPLWAILSNTLLFLDAGHEKHERAEAIVRDRKAPRS
jgi:hypothetical protein